MTIRPLAATEDINVNPRVPITTAAATPVFDCQRQLRPAFMGRRIRSLVPKLPLGAESICVTGHKKLAPVGRNHLLAGGATGGRRLSRRYCSERHLWPEQRGNRIRTLQYTLRAAEAIGITNNARTLALF
jgi:hypothetical protein